MSCVICFEECKDNFKIPKDCNCQFLIHKKCHEKLLLFSKINCVYCRKKKSKYSTINSITYIYNLPAPVAVISWFIFSNLITFGFLVPITVAMFLIKDNENKYLQILKFLMSFTMYYYSIYYIFFYISFNI